LSRTGVAVALLTTLVILAASLPAVDFSSPAVSRPSSPSPIQPTGTRVGGPISGIVTWTPAGNPYWIEGSVDVTAGSTLYIDAGVQVLFNRSSTLVVIGSLEAIGTAAAPVTFSPNATKPGPSDNVYITVSGSFLARDATIEEGKILADGADDFVLERVHLAEAEEIWLNDVHTVSITSNEIVNISGAGIQEMGSSSLDISYNVLRSRPGTFNADAISTQANDAQIFGNVIEGRFSQCILVEGDRTSVIGNEARDCSWGVLVSGFSPSQPISDVLVAGNRIRRVEGGQAGIGVILARNATVRDNEVSGNGGSGFVLDTVEYANVTGNTIVSNAIGIYLSFSSNVTLSDNTLRSNGLGAWVRDTGGPNYVYHNWFVGNVVQAEDDFLRTVWDDGYPSGGNHWSDYAGDDILQGPMQDIPGADGIGDTPRPVGPKGVDRYPFYTVPAPGVPRNLTAQSAGPDVIITWKPARLADSYLLYEADTPTGFDFSAPAVSLGNVMTWTDAGAALNVGSRYYVLRARNATWNRAGATSNTAGKWTQAFTGGTATLSLPLYPYPWIDYAQPGWVDTVGEFVAATGASSFAYMEAGAWRFVPGTGDPARALKVGEGYVGTFTAPATSTFTGLPGAMIDYAGWPPYALSGFDPDTTARTIAATASGADVVVTWSEIPGFGLPNETYEVYVASTPSGLRGDPWTDSKLLATVPAKGTGTASVVHAGALLSGTQWFYFVVPVQDSYWRGPSTYSVGVSAISLGPGYRALGLPLRPYASGIYVTPDISSLLAPNITGVLWYDIARGDWVPHAAWMPPGMYDTGLTMVMAIQVSASTPTMVVFTGV
jgi:parallel beta-helix repeat protein